jgi:hypothetical protein
MLFCTLFIIAFIIAASLASLYFTSTSGYDADIFIGLFTAFFLGGVLGLILVFPAAGFTNGAGKNYGQGTVSGTVVSAWTEGAIYKTHEVKIKQGHGESMDFLELSDYDMKPYLGKKVRVEFDLYWLADYKRGETHRYIKSVKVIE